MESSETSTLRKRWASKFLKRNCEGSCFICAHLSTFARTPQRLQKKMDSLQVAICMYIIYIYSNNHQFPFEKNGSFITPLLHKHMPISRPRLFRGFLRERNGQFTLGWLLQNKNVETHGEISSERRKQQKKPAPKIIYIHGGFSTSMLVSWRVNGKMIKKHIY